MWDWGLAMNSEGVEGFDTLSVNFLLTFLCFPWRVSLKTIETLATVDNRSLCVGLQSGVKGGTDDRKRAPGKNQRKDKRIPSKPYRRGND